MSFEFPTRTLGEMVVNHDRRRVPIKASNRKPGPYPYYGAQGVVDHVHDFIFDGEFVLVAEDGENLRSRNEPVAQIANGKIWVNNHAHILQANELSNNWFLEAAINHSSLSSYVSGSTIPKLNKANLHKIPIPCPPKPMQDEIGAFLRSLADKIANNRALAADLEAIARAIFKSWFVDFDPVKAKMAGRAPVGMDADTASLFPDELVESELGSIPKGWEVAPLDSKARLDTTSVKPFDQPETKWSHYSIPAFDDSGYPANDLGSEIKSGKHLVNPEAILVSKLNPSQWRCWRPDPAVVDKHAICSPEFMQIVGKGISRNWIWGLCHSQPFKDLVNSTTDGTTGSRQRAKPKLVMQQPVVFPTSGIANAYEKLVHPILVRSDVLVHEIQELSALRDSLLPRLITGKLRLPEAEAVIEREAVQ